MKCRPCLPVGSKYTIGFLLSVGFVYWTVVAVNKFLSQPVSTHTTYTIGNDDQFITFPHITWCQNTPVELNTFRQSAADDFLTLMQRALKNESFDVDDYDRTSAILPQEMYAYYQVAYGQPKIDFRSALYHKYNPIYGSCLELDTENVTFPIASASKDLYMEFAWNYSLFGKARTQRIIFHSKYDASDAFNLYQIHNEGSGQYIYLTKKIISRESTQVSPCEKFSEETCREVKGNQNVALKLNCKVQFLYSGKYLNELIDGYRDLPFCPKALMLRALEIYNDTYEECKHSRPCEKHKFKSTEEWEEGALNWLVVSYSDLEVEHHISTINYDLQSLIGEVGGVLGMFLGLSILSMCQDIIKYICRAF